jgi:hypothetical protein
VEENIHEINFSNEVAARMQSLIENIVLIDGGTHVLSLVLQSKVFWRARE